MLISIEWLKEFVDLSELDVPKVTDTLTFLGLEVERSEDFQAFDPNIVIGTVVDFISHPNATKLRLCTIDVGTGETIQIVCGASNFKVNDQVIVAKAPSTLFDGKLIDNTRIRDVDSCGMLCSADEMGLMDSSDGIYIFNEKIPNGTTLESICPRKDSVLELKITPNRGDCLSYIGIARDLSAKLKRPLKLPNISSEISALTDKAKLLSVKLEDQVASLRFCALELHDVEAITSPLWMIRRLKFSGIRSKNILIDLTNYLMLETGQPIHAYDLDKIASKNISVKSGLKNQHFLALDGKKYDLHEEDIVITDEQSVIALAGVMGGSNSEVSSITKNILLEVAQFSPIAIRKTSKRLGLSSEASYRFERGIDINNLRYVILRAFEILASCLGSSKISCQGFLDNYPVVKQPAKIAVRLSRVRKLMGMPVLSSEQCISHLERLGIKLLDQTEDRLLFEVPTYRNDIEREVDLIEEIARMEGYENVSYDLPRMLIAPNQEDKIIEFTENVRSIIAGLGLSEIITYPFSSLKDYEKLLITEEHFLWPTIALENPLSEEFSRLRSFLLPNTLKALVYNKNRGKHGIRLFEMSRAFCGLDKLSTDQRPDSFYRNYLKKQRYLAEKAATESQRPNERLFLSGILDSPYVKKSWNTAEVHVDFYNGKYTLERLCNSLGLQQSISFRKFAKEAFPFLHPNASACLEVNGKTVGWIGEIHPQCTHNFDLINNVVAFEVDVEALFEQFQKRKKLSASITRFPAAERDLCFEISKEITYSDFNSAVFSNPKKEFLQSLEVFDVYFGEKVASHKKSIAASYTFSSPQKTLTLKEVDKEVDSIISWLKETVGAIQR